MPALTRDDWIVPSPRKVATITATFVASQGGGFFQGRHRASLLSTVPSPGTKGRACLALSR